MTDLRSIIIDKIHKEGPITFETFMDFALYYPGLGYYTSPHTEIGRSGDFYTGPHLHPIFGALIARQIEEMWGLMGRPSDFVIVEAGAGKGYLCHDILSYLSERDLYNSVHYKIIEINPDVRESQTRLLRRFEDRVSWIGSLEEIQGIRGCIISNELIDAFPVHVVKMERGRLKEVFVSSDGNGLTGVLDEPSTGEIEDYFRDVNLNFPDGYRTEVNLRARQWLKDIGDSLKEGFVFTIDYGYSSREYYDPERSSGTLLCYHRHQVVENPYINIGNQDITVHVNFSALRKWGEESGLMPVGYCPQGIFLIAMGIDELLQEIYETSRDYTSEVLKLKALILPQGMGDSHQVFIQYKGNILPFSLRGFSIRNHVGRLTHHDLLSS